MIEGRDKALNGERGAAGGAVSRCFRLRCPKCVIPQLILGITRGEKGKARSESKRAQHSVDANAGRSAFACPQLKRGLRLRPRTLLGADVANGMHVYTNLREHGLYRRSVNWTGGPDRWNTIHRGVCGPYFMVSYGPEQTYGQAQNKSQYQKSDDRPDRRANTEMNTKARTLHTQTHVWALLENRSKADLLLVAILTRQNETAPPARAGHERRPVN